MRKYAQAGIRPPVAWCIPSRGHPDAKWVQAMFMMTKHPEDAMWYGFGTLVDANRNVLTEAFLESPYEWMVQWDDDVVFLELGTDNIARMIATAKATGAKIVSGVYVQKKPPFYPHLYMDVTEDPRQKRRLYTPITEYPEGRVIEVDGVGGGCLLIHRDVIQAMAEPTERQWFTFRFGFGEDLSFCHQARQLGYKIIADTKIKLGHLTTEALTVDNYIAHSIRIAKEETVVSAMNEIKERMVERAEGTPTDVRLMELHEQAKDSLRKHLGKEGERIARLDPHKAVMEAGDEWRERAPQTREEVEDHYRKAEHYFADLLLWNTTKEYQRRIVKPLRLQGARVADFGGGIGTLSILFAKQNREVFHIDLPGPTRDFAEQRFFDLGLHAEQHDTDAPERGYIHVRGDLINIIGLDMVTAIDVLEHIHPDAIDETAKQIADSLRRGGRFFHESTFETSNVDHPQHYDTDAEWQMALKKAGLRKYDDQTWIKE